jgi:hypothetical protein
MLIQSLPENDCNLTEFAYAYNYQGIYSTCGHRGIGVTFDADNLEKVEYVRIVLIRKYILSFCFYQVLLKIQLMH